MTFDDAVAAARAKRSADAAQADERAVREERERDAGRRELATLVSEAWRVLSAAGRPPAVEMVKVSRKGVLGRAKTRYVAGRDLQMLGASGLAITGDLELVHAGWLSAERLREVRFVPPAGRAAAWVREPASLEMVYPSGYDDGFYVRDGHLVYGATENWSPMLASEMFAHWVAESLDGS